MSAGSQRVKGTRTIYQRTLQPSSFKSGVQASEALEKKRNYTWDRETGHTGRTSVLGCTLAVRGGGP